MQNANLTYRGFSLIELMVVVAMIAITVTLAVPAFQTSSANQKIASTKKSIRSTLANARTEAVSRGFSAGICASSDQSTCGADWSGGWISYLNLDGVSGYNSATDELLAVYPAVSAAVTVSYSQGAALEYSSQGFLSGNAGDFVFCYTDEADPAVPVYARALLVGASGVVRNSVDSDNSGVYEDSGGDIICP